MRKSTSFGRERQHKYDEAAASATLFDTLPHVATLRLLPAHREDQHGLPLLPCGALPCSAVGDGERPRLPLARHDVL